MTTLPLPIKGRWLREIVAGRKRIEYRDAVPHYDRLLGGPRRWTHIRLRAGYATDAPVAVYSISRVIRSRGVYRIHLGECVSLERIPVGWERGS